MIHLHSLSHRNRRLLNVCLNQVLVTEEHILLLVLWLFNILASALYLILVISFTLVNEKRVLTCFDLQ